LLGELISLPLYLTTSIMIATFLKFGSKENIEDSYQNDYLYFSCLSSFRRPDSKKEFISDPREGNVYQRPIQELKITLKDKIIKFHDMPVYNAQYIIHPTFIPNRICSLYSLKTEHLGIETSACVDNRMFRNDRKVLLIYSISDFFSDLDDSLKSMGIDFIRDEVVYYDKKIYSGDLTQLHKEADYQFQNEYRIILMGEGIDPKIPLPNLKNYAMVVSNEDVKSMKLVVQPRFSEE